MCAVLSLVLLRAGSVNCVLRSWWTPVISSLGSSYLFLKKLAKNQQISQHLWLRPLKFKAQWNLEASPLSNITLHSSFQMKEHEPQRGKMLKPHSLFWAAPATEARSSPWSPSHLYLSVFWTWGCGGGLLSQLQAAGRPLGSHPTSLGLCRASE